MTAPRIVSLLPSTTEVVAALGLSTQLVGRSHECDFPVELAGVPVLTRPRIDPAKPSRALHRDIVALIERALSVFEVDAGRLRAVRPDVILTQHQCAACAVSDADLEAALGEWIGHPPIVVSLAPAALEAVWDSFGTVGEALGLGWAGRELAERARERTAILGARAAALKTRASVACIEWFDPPMVAGNWIPEMVAIAGGRAVLAEPGRHSGFTTLSAIAAADADMMVLMPCGFDLERTVSEGRDFLARATLAKSRAVRESRIWAVDGNAYFNRPGPRLVASVEILAGILHPQAFSFAGEGAAWQRMPE